MKKYQVKVYTLAGAYKTTISPNIVMSDISFGKNIDGGLTTANIRLDEAFGNTDFSESNVVKITVFDENNTSGLLIYTGVINGINRSQDTSSETITLECYGMSSLLGQIVYESGASKVFTKSDDPANIIKDIIDYANTIYTGGRFSYSGGNVDTYGTSVSIDFNYTTCLKALKETKETTNFRWYINQEGQVYFKARPTTATHGLTNKKDVEQINIDENITNIVNKLHVKRKGGTYKTYTDSGSQTAYGIKEKKIDKTDLTNEASQDEFGNNYISENKYPKKETKIVVNSKYDIDSIKPGDTIYVNNISYQGVNNIFEQIEDINGDPLVDINGGFVCLAIGSLRQVLKVKYTPDKVILSLDKLVTFAEEVNKENL